MKIRRKIFVITIIVILFLIIAAYLIISKTTMNDILRIEDERIQKDAARVTDAALVNLDAMDMTSSDYATWDNTYFFVLGQNENFSITDVNPGTLERIGINLFIIIDENGTILFARQYDSGIEKNITPDDPAFAYFRNNGLSLFPQGSDTSKKGFIILPDGVALISVKKIFPTSGEEPSPGILIFARMMNKGFVDKISSQMHLNISAYVYDSALPDDVAQVKPLMNANNSIVVRSIDENTIEGYALLSDMDGHPAMILDVQEPREIYAQGKSDMLYMMLSLIIVGIISAVIFSLMINAFFVKRLTVIDTFMKEMAEKKILSSRLPVGEDDELSSLAKTMNKAFDSVDEVTAEKQAIFEANPDAYFYIDASGKIFDFKFSTFLDHEKELSETKEVSLSIFFSPETIGNILVARAESAKSGQPAILESIINLDGTDKYLELRVVSMKDSKSLVIVRDITETKTVENEIIRKNEDLEKFNRFATDRELKMIELKKQIDELTEKSLQGTK